MSRSATILNQLDEVIRMTWFTKGYDTKSPDTKAKLAKLGYNVSGPRSHGGVSKNGLVALWQKLITRNFPEAGKWLGEGVTTAIKHSDPSLSSFVSQWSNLAIIITGNDTSKHGSELSDPALHNRRNTGWVSHFCFHNQGFTSTQRVKADSTGIYIGNVKFTEASSEIKSTQDLLKELKYVGTTPAGAPVGRRADRQLGSETTPRVSKSIGGAVNVKMKVPKDQDQWTSIHAALSKFLDGGDPISGLNIDDLTVTVFKKGDTIVVDWYEIKA